MLPLNAFSPCLDSNCALSGAHLSSLLGNKLTLDIKRIVLWSDSTTVLTCLRSKSCHFKVFVGTCVAEIQESTHSHAWRYVDSAQNPADDITCGNSLPELTRLNRWSKVPPFLLLSPEQWPPEPRGILAEPPGQSELPFVEFLPPLTSPPRTSANMTPGHSFWEPKAVKLHRLMNILKQRCAS